MRKKKQNVIKSTFCAAPCDFYLWKVPQFPMAIILFNHYLTRKVPQRSTDLLLKTVLAKRHHYSPERSQTKRCFNVFSRVVWAGKLKGDHKLSVFVFFPQSQLLSYGNKSSAANSTKHWHWCKGKKKVWSVTRPNYPSVNSIFIICPFIHLLLIFLCNNLLFLFKWITFPSVSCFYFILFFL